METKGVVKEIGRTRIALVDRPLATAFICSLNVAPRNDSSREVIRFSEEATAAHDTIDHVDTVVVPLLTHVLRPLGMATGKWSVTLEPLEAAAAHELPVSMSGYSADLPLFLALLSASLRLPLRGDVVATGRFASSMGEVGLVKHIAEKLTAARKHPQIRQFVCPSFGTDGSLDALAPVEHDRLSEALARARGHLRVSFVRGVDSLVREVFDEEDLCISSLQTGYFSQPRELTETDTPASRAARHLVEENEKRFWQSLSRAFGVQDRELSAKLMTSFLGYYDARGAYPSGAGARVLHLLRSLPPVLRKAIRSPIVSPKVCLAVRRHAEEKDAEDAELLLHVNRGQAWNVKVGLIDETPARVSEPADDDEVYDRVWDAILRQFREDHFTGTIDWDIDQARLSFTLNSAVVRSDEEFVEIVTSYYLRLQSNTGVLYTPEASDKAYFDAVALVEEAFHKEGGLRAAQLQARQGTNGGLRTVIARMTETFKMKVHQDHFILMSGTALDGRDKDAKEKLVRAFLRKFGDLLPKDVAEADPKYIAEHWSTIVRACAQYLDRIKNMIRKL